MAMSGAKHADSPMMEMNTTPLIDVLLVLLIMFIITIPIATHTVEIRLPASVDSTELPPIYPIKNRLVLTADGAMLWNGSPIDQPMLESALQQTQAMATEPELQFAPEANASYDLSARVLSVIDASGVTKFGFVDNEKYRVFGR